MVKQKKSNLPLRIFLFFLIFTIIICICVYTFFKLRFDTYFVKEEAQKSYGFVSDIDLAAIKISNEAHDEIQALPKIYVIPRNQYKAPVPDDGCYNAKFTKYSDKTITARYYSKKYFGSVFHFVDVKIAHPSQIRVALANNEFGSAIDYPQQIAKDVNAVAAVNGCYYNRRGTGVLIYQGKTCKMNAGGLQVLLIDSEGDFHITRDYNVKSGEILEKYDIVSAVTFGPALVRNGKAQEINWEMWEPDTREPRAAIAQVGKLHYFICTVDGRQGHSEGVTMQEFADALVQNGCKIAYNLDGGQSATLIMDNRVQNKVAYGGQRRLGDIVYFATALDE